MRVEEPRIIGPQNHPIYKVRRACKHKKGYYQNGEFTSDQAIEEASKDLIFCYKQCLTLGATLDCTKNIDFPTLSADVGFPRSNAVLIAITTVFNYLKKNPQSYECVNFYFKKCSDGELYRKFLMEYYKPITIYLLYFIHKDQQSAPSTVPHNVINNIAWLMHRLLTNV